MEDKSTTPIKPLLTHSIVPYDYQQDGIEFGINHDR